MKTFSLRIVDQNHLEDISRVVSFVGADASGSFGIMAGHAKYVTSLVLGLCRYRINDGSWHYLALPGGILYFEGSMMRISTRRFLRADDYEFLDRRLREEIVAEAKQSQAMRAELRRVDLELLRRLLSAT
jgi:F-type H+-transporting ATPase subunit epsilon